MKTCPRVLAACAIFIFSAGSLDAQGSITSTGQFTATIGTFGPPPVIGEPYSATMETEVSQTLADGTHIQEKTMTQKIYRDSQGRTRSEEYVLDPANMNADAQTPANILIHDPVAGVTFMLNPRDRTARQLMPPQRPNPSLPPRNLTPSRPPEVPESLRPRLPTESLGTQMLEGPLVTGTRTTTTIPTGAQGNDRPIVIVNELWSSKDLRLTVLAKTSDPRTGDRTMRASNIDRNDPDPSLFQIPADFTIVQQPQ